MRVEMLDADEEEVEDAVEEADDDEEELEPPVMLNWVP